MEMNNLKWIGKSHAYSRGGNDVSVRIMESGGRRAVHFTFRGDSHKFIADDIEYMEFAVFKNRIFFRKADKQNGYKLAISKQDAERGATSRYCKCYSDELVASCIPYEGKSYDIKYDEFYELYYIEREE